VDGRDKPGHDEKEKSKRPGISPGPLHFCLMAVPDQQCTTSLSLVLHRIRDDAYGVT
jgi:hypothetical protein